MEIGLALGSNLGDRLDHLRRARAWLVSLPGLRVLASAPVYETEPVDVAQQFESLRFLNTVVIVDYPDVMKLAPQLWAGQEILDRARQHGLNEPRTIDMDILYADQLEIKTTDWIIPHPRWAGRSFVVKPLSDVRPDLTIPGQTRTVREILLSLPDAVGMVPFCQP